MSTSINADVTSTKSSNHQDSESEASELEIIMIKEDKKLETVMNKEDRKKEDLILTIRDNTMRKIPTSQTLATQ